MNRLYVLSTALLICSAPCFGMILNETNILKSHIEYIKKSTAFNDDSGIRLLRSLQMGCKHNEHSILYILKNRSSDTIAHDMTQAEQLKNDLKSALGKIDCTTTNRFIWSKLANIKITTNNLPNLFAQDLIETMVLSEELLCICDMIIEEKEAGNPKFDTAEQFEASLKDATLNNVSKLCSNYPQIDAQLKNMFDRLQ